MFHKFEIITVDAAAAGLDVQDFLVCRTCGTSAGPANLDKMTSGGHPIDLYLGGFLAGTPLYNLGSKCDIARQKIDAYVDKFPEYAALVRKERGLLPDPSESETRPSVAKAFIPAEAMYEAWRSKIHGFTMTWSELHDDLRAGWIAAANWARNYYLYNK